MPSKFSILLALTSAALVSAHGYINPIVIGGKSYAGPTPYQNPMDSIIRQVSGVEPVQDMTSPNMACGLNAKTASLVGDALPGDTVEFHWLSGGSGQVRLLVASYMELANPVNISGPISSDPCRPTWPSVAATARLSMAQLSNGSRFSRLASSQTVHGSKETHVCISKPAVLSHLLILHLCSCQEPPSSHHSPQRYQVRRLPPPP